MFGRGGEEVLHLARHGIEAELVPGITAALGVRRQQLPSPDPQGAGPALSDPGDGGTWDGRARLSGLAGAGRAGHTLVFTWGLERAARIRGKGC